MLLACIHGHGHGHSCYAHGHGHGHAMVMVVPDKKPEPDAEAPAEPRLSENQFKPHYQPLTSYKMYCLRHSGVMCADKCSANFMSTCQTCSRRIKE